MKNVVLRTVYLTKRQDDFITRLMRERKWTRDKTTLFLLQLGMK